VDEIGTRAVLYPQLSIGIIQLQSTLKTTQCTDNVLLYWNIQLQFMLHTHVISRAVELTRLMH